MAERRAAPPRPLNGLTLVGLVMRTSTVLSLVNALAAALLLIVLAVTAQTGGLRVTPQMIVEATNGTNPEAGFDLLSRGIEQTQRRASILKWLCYASLALLVINCIGWAMWRGDRRPTNPPLERTGPAV